ncbi:hypothetical protein BASA84_000475 [Batrachochytrium salamandrivorans]|nr:hypothetical protein BASA84_000475 [Batrachochytrium salamandrivorans]
MVPKTLPPLDSSELADLLEIRVSSRLFKIIRRKPGSNDNIMISISPVHKRPAEIIPLRECDNDDDDDDDDDDE